MFVVSMSSYACREKLLLFRRRNDHLSVVLQFSQSRLFIWPQATSGTVSLT